MPGQHIRTTPWMYVGIGGVLLVAAGPGHTDPRGVDSDGRVSRNGFHNINPSTANAKAQTRNLFNRADPMDIDDFNWMTAPLEEDGDASIDWAHLAQVTQDPSSPHDHTPQGLQNEPSSSAQSDDEDEDEDEESKQQAIATVRQMAKEGRRAIVPVLHSNAHDAIALINTVKGRTDPLGWEWQRSGRQWGSGVGGSYRQWKVNDVTHDHHLAEYLPPMNTALRALPGGKPGSAPHVRVTPNLDPFGPGIGIYRVQSEEYKMHSHPFTETMGQYNTVYNVIDGVVISISSNDPVDALQRDKGETRPEADLPFLHTWSDTTGADWQKYHSATVSSVLPAGFLGRYGLHLNSLEWMKSHLKYIILQHVGQPPHTMHIVSECLASRGQYWEGEHFPTWHQRQTFPIGHWCYYALVASKPGSDVVWLLAQRKEIFGIKTIRSITIFFGDVTSEAVRSYAEQPSFLFEIVDHDHTMLVMETLYRRQWHTTGQGLGQGALPHINFAKIAS